MIVNQIKKMREVEFVKFRSEYIDHLKGYNIQYLDGRTIVNPQDYSTFFKTSYNLKNYFGYNLDRLVDCLCDLDFRYDYQGYILVIYNYSEFLRGSEDNKKIFESILESLAHYLDRECLTTSGGRNNLTNFDIYLVDDNIEI